MLKTKHFFPFIKMVKALDIKDELKEIYNKTKGKKKEDLDQLDKEEGIDYLFLFIEKLPNAEKEVMDFLALYTGKSKGDLDELDIDDTWNILKDLFMDEKFKVFFQRAVKSIQ